MVTRGLSYIAWIDQKIAHLGNQVIHNQVKANKKLFGKYCINWLCFTVLQKCSYARMCHGHNTHKSSYTHIFLKKRGDKRQMSSHGNATTLGWLWSKREAKFTR